MRPTVTPTLAEIAAQPELGDQLPGTVAGGANLSVALVV
jgi:hypothetical protein